MNTIHIIPENDKMEHEQSEDCICGPKVEYVLGSKLVKHHSLDGREGNESSTEGQ